MNEEILKVLRELQGSVNDINQRGVDRLAVPAELKPGANVDAATRRKVLDDYTAAVYAQHPSQWTREQASLIRERINDVLADL